MGDGFPAEGAGGVCVGAGIGRCPVLSNHSCRGKKDEAVGRKAQNSMTC